jgi:RimJ/RimL family protein N-acetyltransferase
MEPIEITAGRLHLRPWRPNDAPAVLAACSDPETQRWTTVPVPYTAEHARSFVEEMGPQGWADDSDYGFAVCDSTTGELLAAMTLRSRPARATWDVGYWADPAARGRGVVSEALGVLCRWGFSELGIERIEWFAAIGNWASRRVAEKAGFTVEGVLRYGLPHREGRQDCWVGARVAVDPEIDTRRLPSYELRTDGVVTLRPWRNEDAEDVRRACSDPLTVRFLPVPSPYTLADGLFYVGRLVPEQWMDGGAANVAVTDATTGKLLGAVGLKLELREHGIGEVGYWTAPWARGHGVAGRAAQLHAHWGLDVLGLNRIELLADVENLASQRAAEKGGFVREGVLRRSRPDRTGEARDMVLFSRIR